MDKDEWLFLKDDDLDDVDLYAFNVGE